MASSNLISMSLFVKADLDEETTVFNSDSDVDGLHNEAVTLAEFREVMANVAPERVRANQVGNDGLLTRSTRESAPAIRSGTDDEQRWQTRR